MLDIRVEWLIAVVFALIAAAALYDRVVDPWLYERKRRKFYERMKRRQGYEN